MQRMYMIMLGIYDKHRPDTCHSLPLHLPVGTDLAIEVPAAGAASNAAKLQPPADC
jgi:hypothetical protein